MSEGLSHSLRSGLKHIKRSYVGMFERFPFLMRLRARYHNFDQLLVIACLSFAAGVCMGIITAQGMNPPEHAAGMPGINSPKSWLRSAFSQTIPVAGVQPDRSYVLSNFEQGSDIKLWKVTSAMIEPSSEYAAQGKYSGKIKFYGAESKLAGVSIEEYFSSRYAVSDWTEYQAFRFSVFNPSDRGSRLVIQIKDRWGTPFKQDVILQAGEEKQVEIPIIKIAGVIHIHAVEQITFFTWDSGRDEEIFLDNIALIPGNPIEGAAQL